MRNQSRLNPIPKRRNAVISITILTFVLIGGLAFAYSLDKLSVKVEAENYTLSLPREWMAESLDAVDGSIGFYRNGKLVGSSEAWHYSNYDGLTTLEGRLERGFEDYIASSLEENHTEQLSQKTIKQRPEGIAAAEMVLLRHTQPAASNDSSYQDIFHYYILPENSTTLYRLNFIADQVNEGMADKIAASFVIHEKKEMLFK